VFSLGFKVFDSASSDVKLDRNNAPIASLQLLEFLVCESRFVKFNYQCLRSIQLYMGYGFFLC